MIEEKGETGVIDMAMTIPTDLEGISFNIPKEDGNTIKAKVVEELKTISIKCPSIQCI